MGLFNLPRRSPDITVGAIRIQPYHEFARNLPVPTNLNLIHLKRCAAQGWWCSRRAPCLSPWITCLAAMGASRPKREGREFTHTEQRVINRMLKLALEGYSDALEGGLIRWKLSTCVRKCR